MATILIAGLINIETTLAIDGFPINYAPVRYPFFGVNSTVSGVGYNLAKALTRLGHTVRFLALIGNDAAGLLVRQALATDSIDASAVLDGLTHTPQSVILYDRDGKRMLYTDLKNIQELAYPSERFAELLTGCDLAVLCNINFARPFLAHTRARGVPIATDVHAIANLEDAYNSDYMAYADLLFQSHELLPCSPSEWLDRLKARYNPRLAVIGMGGKGALLGGYAMGEPYHCPAVVTRPIKSTVGAGDALCAGFIDGWLRGYAPEAALQRATLFASYKIGSIGAAEGFLGVAELERLWRGE